MRFTVCLACGLTLALSACKSAKSREHGLGFDASAVLAGGGDAAPADAGALLFDAAAMDAGAPFGLDEAGKPGCGFVTGKLDLLMMVDNSSSMAHEQALLAQELPRMIAALASGDVNGDGKQDHPQADMHVGVISTDMGISGLTESTVCSSLGDDGILRKPTNCGTDPLNYLVYAPDAGTSVDAFEAAAACQVRLGTDGCGLEQPLESTLKALTPSSAPTRFDLDAAGQADGPNAGFLRDDALLVIVEVTDEDDCSFPSSSVGFTLYYGGPYGDAGLNYRCQARPEALYPIDRYTETLPKLRANAVGGVLFAVIAGVPPDLVDAITDAGIEGILADPRMAFAPNGDPGSTATMPVPACTIDRVLDDGGIEHVSATPARRLLEVAKSFDDRAIVGSICRQDFQKSIEAIAKRIGGVLACPEIPVLY
jgi:hypothetical protein